MVKFLLGPAAPDIGAGLWHSPMLLALPLARRSEEVRGPFLKTYKLALFASIHEVSLGKYPLWWGTHVSGSTPGSTG